jgi:HEPN domain-containing protein
MSCDEKSMSLAESFLKRAYNKLSEARGHLEMFHYAESVSSSQECIELSVKTIFLLLHGGLPRKHEFSEEEFENVLRKIPSEYYKSHEYFCGYVDLCKVYLYSKFWSQFYTVAKYGFDRLGVGADKLFGREEAELALKHASACYTCASTLFNWIRGQRVATQACARGAGGG